MSLPSASSHQRAAECPPSEVLPHSKTTDAGNTRGRHLHKFLQDVSELGRDKAVEAAPAEYRAAFEAINLDKISPLHSSKYVPEAAFAYDVDTLTVRLIPDVVERGYGVLRPTEFPGTIDTHALAGDTVVVYDYKSGHAPADTPSENWQLRSYGLMLARYYGVNNVKFGLIRVREDGDVFFEVSELNEAELNAYELRVVEAMERILKLRANPRPEDVRETHEGRWCRYCPALAYCPSKNTLVRAVTNEPDAMEQIGVELTPERAAMAWNRLKAAEALIERLKDVVKNYARQHPVDLSDDLVLADVIKTKDRLVGDIAFQLLKEAYGPDVAEKAAPMERNATKTGVRAALNTIVNTIPGAKITKLMEGTIEELRARGGIITKTWNEVEVVKRARLEKQQLEAAPAMVMIPDYGLVPATPQGEIFPVKETPTETINGAVVEANTNF